MIHLDRAILGDNQFFGINHLSDEKSRAQALKFRNSKAIMYVLDQSLDIGINTFMCTTHDKMKEIAEIFRNNPSRYQDFKTYPCLPYAHKYANDITELGILGTFKKYIPGNILSYSAKGGVAYLTKDMVKFMEMLVDAELKFFQGLQTPVIFLQNVIVDLISGLGMKQLFFEYKCYIEKKYNAESGFITMNMPRIFDDLEVVGINNPIICSSINKIGFRMSGGSERYIKYLEEKTIRPIAMQVFAGGAINPNDAIQYIASLPNIQSVLFGASSIAHIKQTKDLIDSHLNIN